MVHGANVHVQILDYFLDKYNIELYKLQISQSLIHCTTSLNHTHTAVPAGRHNSAVAGMPAAITHSPSTQLGPLKLRSRLRNSAFHPSWQSVKSLHTVLVHLVNGKISESKHFEVPTDEKTNCIWKCDTGNRNIEKTID